MDFFIEENRKPDSDEKHISPSGKYTLITSLYKTKEGCWNYSRGEVYAGTNKVADIYRNYSSFPFGWAENHPNGHDYLICSENYQGQTVIELDTGVRIDYLPESAKKGFGFCMASFCPSPDKTRLVIEGCFWGGPYDLLIVDFSSPMTLPWPILSERDLNFDSVEEWTNDGIILNREIECRASDGKREADLTSEELVEVHANNFAGMGTIKQKVLLKDDVETVLSEVIEKWT